MNDCLLAVTLDTSTENAQIWNVDKEYVKKNFVETGLLYSIVFNKIDNNLPIIKFEENGQETERILITIPSLIKASCYNNNCITLNDFVLFIKAISSEASLKIELSKVDDITKIKFLSIGHYLGLANKITTRKKSDKVT